MRMYADDMKKYPNFCNYVKDKLPLIRNSDTKISNIFELAQKVKGEKEFSEDDVKNALVWGNGPTIKISNMLGFGKYVPKRNKNEIHIRRKWVKDYEKNQELKMTKWGEEYYLVEVILLHELTHWADLQDGMQQPKDGLEIGDEFERIIYLEILK